MTLSRTFCSTRVCSEVPGRKDDRVRLIGRPLSISTEPIASNGGDGDLQARRGRSQNAEPEKIAGSVVPIAPRSLETGQPPERWKTATRCHWDDDLTSDRRVGAEKSRRRTA